jgi:hypothetical protein
MIIYYLGCFLIRDAGFWMLDTGYQLLDFEGRRYSFAAKRLFGNK